MTKFETPLEWKSEIWWQNRSLDERLFHLHLPTRIVGQGMRMDVAHEYDYFKGWSTGRSLLITGLPGTGKSTAAAEILDALTREYQIAGRWVEADDYIEMIKDSFDNDGSLPEMYSSPHIIKYLKVWDIVVIDGLGEERKTEFAQHELGSLIRKRYDRNKSTIITSSLKFKDIIDRYGQRVATALTDFDVLDAR